jgi:hypothetical protein
VDPEALAERLRQASLRAEGATSSELRRKVHDRVRAVARKEDVAVSLPAEAVTFVDSVALRSNEAQPEALLAAGKSEDEIFETAVVAAVAAGLLRMEEGLRAARETK